MGKGHDAFRRASLSAHAASARSSSLPRSTASMSGARRVSGGSGVSATRSNMLHSVSSHRHSARQWVVRDEGQFGVLGVGRVWRAVVAERVQQARAADQAREAEAVVGERGPSGPTGRGRATAHTGLQRLLAQIRVARYRADFAFGKRGEGILDTYRRPRLRDLEDRSVEVVKRSVWGGGQQRASVRPA